MVEPSEAAIEAPAGDAWEGVIVAGTYRVGRLLASGGMGEVREAEHVRLGRPVAIKFLRASMLAEQGSAERFRHEARRAAAVRSDHVVKVFDYGQLDDGTPYLAMERLVGEDLQALLAREGPLPIRRATKLALDACRGLSAVHAAGLVHRDLKPANLFIERAVDGRERCIILDFGVAKAVASDTTRPGALVGTVRYMAPEQLENSAAAGASADTYALGAILYEALTGVPAHGGDTLEEMMFDIIHRDAKSPSEFRALPEQLEAAVLRMLARTVQGRFPRIEDAARALAPFGTAEEIRAPRADPADTTVRDAEDAGRSRPPSRQRSWALTAALAAASGLGAGGGWYARDRQAEPAAPERVAYAALRPVAELRPVTALTPGEQASSPQAPTSVLVPALPTSAQAPHVPEPAAAFMRGSAFPARSNGGGKQPGQAAPLPSSRTRVPAPSETSLPSAYDPTDPYE